MNPNPTFYRRMAIVGYCLPYVSTLCFVLLFRSVVGHAGNTATPGELNSYDRITSYATMIGVGLSVPLTLPGALLRVRKANALSDDSRRSSQDNVAPMLRYLSLLVANAVAVILFKGVVSMLTENVK
jgi:hypothetical protein